MYPCERYYLGTLKSYVRNKTHPEASMTNEYAAEDALGLCIENLNLQEQIKKHVWESIEEVFTRALVVEGRGYVFNFSEAELRRAYNQQILFGRLFAFNAIS